MLKNLSLITIANNGEKYINSYIKNISKLLECNCRIIFINDASDDDTSYIKDKINHKNFTYIQFDENKGIGKLRNYAIEICETDIMAYMDIDDWINPDEFIKVYQYMAKNYAIDCIRVSHVRVKDRNREIKKVPTDIFYENIPIKDRIGDINKTTLVDYPYSWAGFYRTESLISREIYFDELESCEDRKFFWKLLLSDAVIYALPNLYYFYCKDENPNSLTQRGDEKQLEFIKAYNNLIDYMKNNEGYVMHKFIRQMVSIIDYHISRKERFNQNDQKILIKGCSDLIKKIDAAERVFLKNTLSKERLRLIETLE